MLAQQIGGLWDTDIEVVLPRDAQILVHSVLEIMPPISKWLQTTSTSCQPSGLVDIGITCGYSLDFLSYTRAQEWKCLNAKSKEKSSG